MNEQTVRTLLHDVGGQAGDPPAPALSETFAHRRHRRRMAMSGGIAAMVVVALAATGLVFGGALRRGNPATDHRSPSEHWTTSTAPHVDFSIDYPATWTATPWDEAGSFVTGIVTISNGFVPKPCYSYRARSGGEVVGCGLPKAALTHGGVIVTWSVVGSPGQPPNPGTPTSVAGHTASITEGTPDRNCSTDDGTLQIQAYINSYQMNACLAGSGDVLKTLRAQVLRSLNSVRIGG